ncbi:hypothetical protein F4821DRAFT_235771 [Hypoxylon rubiginosum]|uniref:Uncharacterized protein n=1 Tax=Hypoxylon rubiginosum TaxID=110542 RepID=A0ACC0D572_9PEZI|nr:hypothetical protein F4821DRAFT_235771 [Hypoxylon rubiginosum]
MQYVIDDSSGPDAGTCYGMGTTYPYCKFESNANDAFDTVDVYESCDLGISENHATLNNAYSGCALATGEWEWGSFILS